MILWPGAYWNTPSWSTWYTGNIVPGCGRYVRVLMCMLRTEYYYHFYWDPSWRERVASSTSLAHQTTFARLKNQYTKLQGANLCNPFLSFFFFSPPPPRLYCPSTPSSTTTMYSVPGCRCFKHTVHPRSDIDGEEEEEEEREQQKIKQPEEFNICHSDKREKGNLIYDHNFIRKSPPPPPPSWASPSGGGGCLSRHDRPKAQGTWEYTHTPAEGGNERGTTSYNHPRYH